MITMNLEHAMRLAHHYVRLFGMPGVTDRGDFGRTWPGLDERGAKAKIAEVAHYHRNNSSLFLDERGKAFLSYAKGLESELAAAAEVQS